MENLIDKEQINWPKFEEYLRKNIPYIPNQEMEIKKFTEGYSNQTYLIKFNEWEAVLRRPPFGEIPPKAHDMKREYKLLSKISKVYSLAPEPFLYGEDASIMNRNFYIMEKKQGIVIDEKLPIGFNDSHKYGPIISKSIMESLVKLQSIDCEKENLLDIGKPDGYLERQVYGWIERFHKSVTDNVLSINSLEKWLIDNKPDTQETTIVHNDFKLNNLVLDEQDVSRVKGVLDWELATVGDPLTDVGSSLAYWIQSTDPDLGINAVSNQPGFYNRRELVEYYSKISKRDVANINYYLAFGFFKLAGILQQIYYRWYKGNINDTRFEDLYKSVNNLIEMAELTKENKIL